MSSSTPPKNPLDTLGDAIKTALAEAPVDQVLSVLTGSFVSLTIEVLRRGGHDTTREIKIDGGRQRDITIHAAK
jgi:hypothetical protein